MYPTMNTKTEIPKLISRPFLLLRLVVFIVLVLLNLLTLSFAAFNITASRTWDQYVSVGPSLAVFNSSLFFFLSLLLIGENKYSHAIPPVSMVLAEVCWMSFMTVFTFVSSVLSTRLGPSIMCPFVPNFANLTTCASSILALPVLWMNFFIFFLYSLTLLIVTFLHEPVVPDIWYFNISEIPWFDFSASFPNGKADLEHQTVYGDAFQSAHPAPVQQTPKPPPRGPWLTFPRASLISTTSFTPAWAKQRNANLTRGLHHPFNSSANHHHSPVRHPTRAITKPTLEGRPHDQSGDPFAALVRHDTIATNVPDDCDDMKQRLEPLAGFDSLFRLTSPTTSSESHGRVQNPVNRSVKATMVQNPPHRSSTTTITTTTVVLSPSDRKSVSSLFPHDLGDEDWNHPLKKPPFRNGRGEGWTTAGATQATDGSGRGSGKYI